MKTGARLTLVALLSMSTAGCDKKKEGDSRDVLRSDSALARDLRIAADTAPYSDAADVAMREDIDTSTRVVDLPRRSNAPVVDLPRRSETAATSSRETTDPVTPVPAAEIPRPPSPAPPSRGVDVSSALAEPESNACASPATADQRRCLLAYLARSDVELDRSYQELIAELKRRAGSEPGAGEPEVVQRLRQAQRNWLVYRDTECRRRNRGQEGPLWAPVRARCLGEFSGARTSELSAAREKLSG